ncbi:MAG: YdhR family protein [Verrucomicrobiae bacterium]|nr:YdhR family protein [Verrucomicrobiae bacterium]
MKHPSLAMLVKFKTSLTLEKVREVAESRIGDFRALKGLTQKYYLQEPATGEFAGLYLWDSQEDFLAYRDSELRASIAETYQVEGEPRVEVFQVVETLRD